VVSTFLGVTLLVPLALVAWLLKPIYDEKPERASHQIEWVMMVTLVLLCLCGTFGCGWFMSALWYRPQTVPPLGALVWSAALGGYLVAAGQSLKRVDKAEREFREAEQAKEKALRDLDQADSLKWDRSWFIRDLDLVLLMVLERTGPEPSSNLFCGWDRDVSEKDLRLSLWKLERARLIEDAGDRHCRIAQTWTGLADYEEKRDGVCCHRLQLTERGRGAISVCFGSDDGFQWSTHQREPVEALVAARMASQEAWRKYEIDNGGRKQ
jgi:hypothetical protein